MHDMVLKIGAYGPVEHADEEAVFRTIVDPTCMVWHRGNAWCENWKFLRHSENGRKTSESSKVRRRMQDPTEGRDDGHSWANGRAYGGRQTACEGPD